MALVSNIAINRFGGVHTCFFLLLSLAFGIVWISVRERRIDERKQKKQFVRECEIKDR